jgi:Cdc6-like AAA superfamily ATPase
MAFTRQERLQLVGKLGTIFSPGAPVDKYALFAGRTSQVRDVLNAVNQRGQHVILFGERGVGKTSLANILSELVESAGISSLRSGTINCDSTDDFSTLWRKVFRELEVTIENQPVGFGRPAEALHRSLNGVAGDSPGPEDIRIILSRIGRTIVTIDELDRIRDRPTTTRIADTIKTLSDHSVPSTIVLVGVADSVDELIAEHLSIERALVQVRMPRMSDAELFEIIDKGVVAAGMQCTQEVRQRIARLSQGLPHYTHLLALHATQTAVLEGRLNVQLSDLEKAIELAVEKAQQSIVSAHHRATSSARKDNIFGRVLLACALASTDQLGYFAPADVRQPLSVIMGRTYDIPAYSRHLNDFCGSARGPVLQSSGSPFRLRFRFLNPMMQPFVIMHGMATGIIDKGTVDQLNTRPR